MAAGTVERFVERALRLYEQDRGEPCGSPRLDAYVRRWGGWARTRQASQDPKTRFTRSCPCEVPVAQLRWLAGDAGPLIIQVPLNIVAIARHCGGQTQ